MKYFNHKLYLNLIKRQFGLTILYTVILILAGPISAILMLQDFEKQTYQNIISLSRTLTINFAVIQGIGLVAVIIFAFMLLSFQNSKKSIDFYHSLPIKKESLYLTNMAAGLSLIILPQIIALSIQFGIIAAFGYIGIVNMPTILTNFILILLLQTAVFTVVFFAGYLTGTTVDHVVFTGFLIAVPLLIMSINQFLFKLFIYDIDNYFGYNIFYRMVTSLSLYDERFHIGEQVNLLKIALIAIAYIILFGVSGFFISRKRKSEKVGSSTTFRSVELFVFTLSMLSGVLVGWTVFRTKSIPWQAFGIIAGGTISYLVSFLIINRGFKKLIKSYANFIISVILTSAYILTFVFGVGLISYHPDGSDYDNNEIRQNEPPKLDEIKSVKFSINGNNMRYDTTHPSILSGFISYDSNDIEFSTEQMKQQILQLHSKVIEYQENDGASIFFFIYQTEDGAKSYYYAVNKVHLDYLIEPIFNLPEYKEKVIPVMENSIILVNRLNQNIQEYQEDQEYQEYQEDRIKEPPIPIQPDRNKITQDIKVFTDYLYRFENKDSADIIEAIKLDIKNSPYSLPDYSENEHLRITMIGSDYTVGDLLSGKKFKYCTFIIPPTFTHTLDILSSKGIDIDKYY